MGVSLVGLHAYGDRHLSKVWVDATDQLGKQGLVSEEYQQVAFMLDLTHTLCA